MYDGDYDFNRDGKLDNNEREIMYDDLDRELNGNDNYHIGGSRRNHNVPNNESGKWTKKDTFDWIIIGIQFASIVIGLMLMFALNTKSGQGIKYICFTVGIGCLISTFIEKGKMKKVYLILSIFLSAGAFLMFLIS